MPAPTTEEIAAAWTRELPGVATESIALITPIWRIAKALEDERRRTLLRLGVESATLDLLSTLRRAGAPYTLTTRELTDRTLVTAGAISQRVARAERAGWVTRAASAATRKAVAVTLTPAGHELVSTTVRELLGHEQRLVSASVGDGRDRRRLAVLLARWEKALSDAR